MTTDISAYVSTGERRVPRTGEFFIFRPRDDRPRDDRDPFVLQQNADSHAPRHVNGATGRGWTDVSREIVVPRDQAATVEVAPATILVRFPGEDGAHDLTVPEAYALFRSLERALDQAGS